MCDCRHSQRDQQEIQAQCQDDSQSSILKPAANAVARLKSSPVLKIRRFFPACRLIVANGGNGANLPIGPFAFIQFPAFGQELV